MEVFLSEIDTVLKCVSIMRYEMFKMSYYLAYRFDISLATVHIAGRAEF